MLKLFIVLSLLISISLSAIPCGRCLGKGEICSKPEDHCQAELTCTTVQRGGSQTAKLCYPAIKPREWCNHTKDYDACEVGFSCDRSVGGTGSCEVVSRYARINDGCKNDNFCANGLFCNNGVCKSNVTGCTSSNHCGWNQFCNTSIGNSQCVDLPGSGQTCSPFRACKFGLICSIDNICISMLSVAEGGACSDIRECKSGLDCFEKVCKKPTFNFLGGPGVLWGQECDPSDGTPGCTCNYGSKIYQYVKEAFIVYPDSCLNVQKDFEKCMTDKGCTNINTGADTCMRKNCYTLYRDLRDSCSEVEPTLRPPRCGAAGLVVIMLFVFMMILL